VSFREVEELMLQRRAIIFYGTVRRWCWKFCQAYADGQRRAVDQDGNVLDVLVQSRRDAKAARRFLAKLMEKQRRVPRVLVTDKLRSYGVAHRELMSSVEYRSHKGLNSRAENSHQPTRQRERAMEYFRSPGGAQRILSVFSSISPHFRPPDGRRGVPRCSAVQYQGP
jgi:putative transposase